MNKHERLWRRGSVEDFHLTPLLQREIWPGMQQLNLSLTALTLIIEGSMVQHINYLIVWSQMKTLLPALHFEAIINASTRSAEQLKDVALLMRSAKIWGSFLLFTVKFELFHTARLTHYETQRNAPLPQMLLWHSDRRKRLLQVSISEICLSPRLHSVSALSLCTYGTATWTFI